mgnify:CR=1 FL=1
MGAINPVRDRLARGEPALGARVRSFSTTLLTVLGRTGVTYGYLDLEHAGFSPYDSDSLERMQTVAEAAGIGLVVRLPAGEPTMIQTALDAGIRTVIVPRVETAAAVERAVRASRFTYEGKPGDRGYGTAAANDWGVRPPGYTEREDETVLVGVMLETAAAVENASDIAAVAGLGFAKIGTGDLAVSLGHPQEEDHPAVQEAVQTLERACRNAEVPLGSGVGSIEAGREVLDEGYQLVDVGGDVEAFRRTIEERFAALDGDDAEGRPDGSQGGRS